MERYELILNGHPGALAHVIGLITGRRWHLGSLEYPQATTVDRRLLVFDLDSGGRGEQVEAQFARLYDVLAVRRIPYSPS